MTGQMSHAQLSEVANATKAQRKLVNQMRQEVRQDQKMFGPILQAADLVTCKSEIVMANSICRALVASKREIEADFETSEAELETTKAELGASKAELAASKAELAASKAELEQCRAQLKRKQQEQEVEFVADHEMIHLLTMLRDSSPSLDSSVTPAMPAAVTTESSKKRRLTRELAELHRFNAVLKQ